MEEQSEITDDSMLKYKYSSELDGNSEVRHSTSTGVKPGKESNIDSSTISDLTTELNTLKSVYSAQEQMLEEREMTILFLREELQTSSSRCLELEALNQELETSLLQRRQNNNNTNRNDNQQDNSRLMSLFQLSEQYETRIEDFESQIQKYETRIDELEKENHIRACRIVELEKKEAHLKQNLDEHSKSSWEMMNLIESLELETKIVKRKSQMEIEDMTSSLQKDLEESTIRFTKLQNDYDYMRSENQRLLKMLDECETILDEKSSALEPCRQSLEVATARLNEIEGPYQSLQNSLKDICERLEYLTDCDKELQLTKQTLLETELKLAEANDMLRGRVPKEQLTAAVTRCEDLEWNIQCLKNTVSDTVDSMTACLMESEEKYAVTNRELEQVRIQLEEAKMKQIASHKAMESRVPRDRLVEAQRQCDELSLQLHTKKEQIAAYVMQLKDCKNQLAETHAENEELKRAAASYDDKNQSFDINGSNVPFRSLECAYQKKIDELNATIISQKNFDFHKIQQDQEYDPWDAVQRLQAECYRMEERLMEKDLTISSLRLYYDKSREQRP